MRQFGFHVGAELLSPLLSTQWQFIQFGPRFAPSRVMLLQESDETLAVLRL
jgi:hypothetical protein